MKKIEKDGKRKWALFITTVFLGVLVRLFVITQRDIFTDEVFYLEAAIKNSITDLLLVNHWIKDHGILYFLFLKCSYIFSHNIVHIRATNLLFYIFSCIMIFLIFRKLYANYLALIPVLLFSVHKYFVYLASVLSPYNLVLSLSLLSLYSLIALLTNKNGKKNYVYSLLFVVSTSLSFYSDYSFGYLIFLYVLIYIAVIFFQKDIRKKKLISVCYSGICLFIAPGIMQIIQHFADIKELNTTAVSIISTYSFFPILKALIQTLFIRVSSEASILLAMLLIAILFYFGTRQKKFIPIFSWSKIVIFTFSLSLISLALFITNFHSLFIERSFWVFYLFFLALSSLTISIFFLLGKKKTGYLFLTCILIVMYLNYTYPQTYGYFAPGDIAQGEIKYIDLLQELNRRVIDKKTNLIFVSDSFAHYPLMHYYFSSLYPSIARHSELVQSIRNKYNVITFITKPQDKARLLAKLSDINDEAIVVFFELNKINNINSPYIKGLNPDNVYYLRGKDDYQLSFYTLSAPLNEIVTKPNELPQFNTSFSMHPYLGYVLNYDTDLSSNSYGFIGDDLKVQDSEKEFTVGIFGGSVSNYYYQYEKNNLIKELTALHITNKKIKVYSLALGGYKEPQQLLTLQYLLSLGYKFDLVINIDGFNEAALSYTDNYKQGISSYFPRFWNLYSRQYLNTQTMALINTVMDLASKRVFFKNLPPILGYVPSKIIDSLYYVNQISLQKRLYEVDKAYQAKGPEPFISKSEDLVKKNIINTWYNSTIQLSKTAQSNNIPYFEFLQPNQYLSDSKPFSEEERRLYINKKSPYASATQDLYPKIIGKVPELKEKGISIFDLTNLFKNEKKSIYIDDCCHYNKEGYRQLTNAMIEIIRQNLDIRGL